ncbi:MAG TPA: hypothetical protein VJ717_05035 [Gemmatimonadaceae bacterium]|nr:hypothetical protein [Gemmatimonadaceae bacterium]
MPDAPEYPERRKNALLRLLINDMMQQIRELQQHQGPWPPEERERVERDLERIMEQVRGAALRNEGA